MSNDFYPKIGRHLWKFPDSVLGTNNFTEIISFVHIIFLTLQELNTYNLLLN